MAVTAPAPDKAAEEAPAKGKPGKRKKLLIIGLVVVLLVGGGGYLLKMKKAHAAKQLKIEATQPGGVEQLDEMTLNLRDGHFLKVGIALQLTKAVTPKPAKGETTVDASHAVDGAQAQDAAISVLGERSYSQLLAPGGREQAQSDLSKEVAKRYEGKVMKVYFTEFVMQ